MKSYIPVIRYIIHKAGDREHAITGREIGNAFGISGANVRSCINEARCDGLPICSCNYGYYYSTRESDLSDTIRHLKGRISKVEKAIEGLNGISIPG